MINLSKSDLLDLEKKLLVDGKLVPSSGTVAERLKEIERELNKFK